MATELPLPYLISQSSTRKRKYRTLSAQFGSGYSQEAPDGIQNVIDEWTIIYENITTAERNFVVAALDEVKSSGTLLWTPPGNDPFAHLYKLTLDGFTETAKSGNIWDISFTMRQVL